MRPDFYVGTEGVEGKKERLRKGERREKRRENDRKRMRERAP